MLQVNTHWFFGREPQFVLIVAGIHESEQSGIEVAHWIRVKLTARPKPTRLGAIVIPDIFPDRGKNARTDEWRVGKAKWDGRGGTAENWREFKLRGKKIKPARQFPPPGQPLGVVLTNGLLKDRSGKNDLKVDGDTVRVFPEIAYLVHCIETIKPVRIVSIHGKRKRDKQDLKAARDAKPPIINMTDDQIDKWDDVTAIKGVNFPGIFVDPRYNPGKACPGIEMEPCKFNADEDPAFPLSGSASSKHFDSATNTKEGSADDALALAAAKAVSDVSLVAGNHVGEPVPVVHYAKEPGTPEAFSLGDWGPVDVLPGTSKPGSRPGAPVFTIEVKDEHESWAFLDGEQVMAADGTAMKTEPPVWDRAAGGKGVANTPSQLSAKFDPARSKELQAYAQAIIDTILEQP